MYLIRYLCVKFYRMPIVDRFNGIKIHIYNGEHRPPHIHAVYNEFAMRKKVKIPRIIKINCCNYLFNILNSNLPNVNSKIRS